MKKKTIIGLVLTWVVLVIFLITRIMDDGKNQKIKEFTAFFDVPGNTINEDNEIKELIAQKIGAYCQEQWLSGKSADEAIASYIASGEYTDFISGNTVLYEAGALIPIDVYWDDYPNIKNFLPSEIWDRFRQADGHVYWIPQFGIVHGKVEEVLHEGEAFWIQTRVLKWAGYPDIRTLDEYFALLEAYVAENPVMENPFRQEEIMENIPFTILCDDWRYFCLENPPQFLDGFPNDGSCMVDTNTRTVLDYNTSETAKRYFKKLNEEYNKGIVDQEFFTQSYQEYLEKIASGRVLGMVDQWWQFAYSVNTSLENMPVQNYGYVPLPITIDRGIQNQWHIKRGAELSVADGISITVSCEDLKGAMQFINDLLDEEILKLRYWGIEGIDYDVYVNGVYYRTPEQRERAKNLDYSNAHFCMYSYFPRIEGMLSDGINAFSPEYQTDEFLNALAPDVKECLVAYGCRNYVEMLGTNNAPGPWFPMYSYSEMLTSETEAGSVWEKMKSIKIHYLPRVVMTEDFEGMWQQYMEDYAACQPEIFFEEMQHELERRIAVVK
ncbi:MAG: extracellular solute-binding protein [Lachnospiraceae bacterium]|jgi:putative aldouronate transport system substrate-binding protein|nr:extracellular solute-binding protein [Lachnospiraceae bacterium]